MTDAEIRQSVLSLLMRVAPEMEPDEVDDDEPLQQALDIDSFDYLNFLVALRDELGVHVQESDYRQLRTLSDVVRFLKPRLDAR